MGKTRLIYNKHILIKAKDLNKKFLIYNGREFQKAIVSKNMIGYKFGEFITTRKVVMFNKKKIMGKQTNAQVTRFHKNGDWLSKYYSDNFNYSNFIVQDNLIRDYVINFISLFNTKVAQVYIYRENERIIVRIFPYNDSFTNFKSFIMKHRKKIT